MSRPYSIGPYNLQTLTNRYIQTERDLFFRFLLIWTDAPYRLGLVDRAMSWEEGKRGKRKENGKQGIGQVRMRPLLSCSLFPISRRLQASRAIPLCGAALAERATAHQEPA
jgi:hypothetical protein